MRMRERPILFNSEMVRAILDGRKTVTRRIVKPQEILHCTKCNDSLDEQFVYDRLAQNIYCARCGYPLAKTSTKGIKAPYNSFDILYVRETYCGLEGKLMGELGKDMVYFYKADGDLRPISWRGAWKPSIHMPKEAARLWLRVTDVRAERLQDITEDQAKCEGIGEEWACAWWAPSYNDPDSGGYPKYRDTFANDLWNRTVKKENLATCGWEANPWVWVIEFEKLKERPIDCNVCEHHEKYFDGKNICTHKASMEGIEVEKSYYDCEEVQECEYFSAKKNQTRKRG